MISFFITHLNVLIVWFRHCLNEQLTLGLGFNTSKERTYLRVVLIIWEKFTISEHEEHVRKINIIFYVYLAASSC